MEKSLPEKNEEILAKINKELKQEEALKEGNFTAISIIGKGTFIANNVGIITTNHDINNLNISHKKSFSR